MMIKTLFMAWYGQIRPDFSKLRKKTDKLDPQFVFHGTEKIEGLKPMVVKKDGTKQLYDPDKILRSLDVACQKRGVSQQVKENIVSDITHLVDERFNKEITSSEIGEFIMTKLMDIDRVSYVRFASVYKNFTDLDSYTAEINNFDVGSTASNEE